MESKRIKENREIEIKLVKARIRNILESMPDMRRFKKMSFEQQWKMGVPLMHEIHNLRQLGFNDELINEQSGVWDLLTKLFGGGLSVATETLFENMLSSFFKKLGLSGFIVDSITFFFARNPTKVIESFKDCRAFTKNVGQAITEGFINKLSKDYKVGGLGADLIRNALMETLENTDFGGKIATQFSDFTCQFFDKVKSKGSQITDILKPAQATS